MKQEARKGEVSEAKQATEQASSVETLNGIKKSGHHVPIF
jgi:hypothetical protein